METQEKFLWGALIGCAIGAGAALMLAPFSGANLRRRIGLPHAEAPRSRRKATASHARQGSHTSHARQTSHAASQSSHSKKPASTRVSRAEKGDKDEKEEKKSPRSARKAPELKAQSKADSSEAST